MLLTGLIAIQLAMVIAAALWALVDVQDELMTHVRRHPWWAQLFVWVWCELGVVGVMGLIIYSCLLPFRIYLGVVLAH